METAKELNERKKEYLRSCRVYMRRIREKEDALAKIELEKQNAHAMEYSGMPHGAGSRADLSNYIVECERLLEEIVRTKNEYSKKRNEIMAAVHAMENMEYAELLELRYMEGLGWKEIAKKMGYERSTIFKKHGKALAEFEMKGEKE